ncbi:DUF4199 domain-containing protein [Phenylobacterium sp.]|uniref:DUF4199 domain-containing protein n=1 Tax=Phenylobacterium sp. TaxID=1871053 RepID=UPI0027213233|nr:DUF4199 domain-containing protein [Phenylobacterium sp.]MDO8801992.1 DUF4199 domain-containing protein [Phenylobacterium sp.]
MTRTILTYGLISGVVAITGIVTSIMLAPDGHGSMLVGYLIMLVALSSILVAVKQYRDGVLGGVIRFRTAFLMGLGIAVVASLAYVAGWEAYLAATGYRFMPEMVAETLAAKRAAGVTGAEYAKVAAEMQAMARAYENPLYRMPMTAAEIFPVGLLVALVSAGLLRMPGFLPARSRPA